MTESFDVAIIGGGVVGCSVLFGLCNHDRCVLIEKHPYLLAEASCGNSGMLHTGFDAPTDSIELKCIKICQQQIFGLLDKFGLPYKKIGATMVAWNELELQRLSEIQQKCHNIGSQDVHRLSLSDLYQIEPCINQTAMGAIHIPGETVIDAWLTPTILAHHSKKRGATILNDTLAQEFDQDTRGYWNITTSTGRIKSNLVINCAGLYGDIVDKLSGFQSFRIKPRKGQYIVYRKTAKSLINSSILPVPTNKGKGIIVFRSVYDNVIVGPTAEDVDSRLIPPIDPAVTNRLTNIGDNCVPGLSSHKVACMYTGVRPATEYKDYQINSYTNRSWLTVGGIRSTGLSGSLGISDMVCDIVKDTFYMEPSSAPFNNIDRVPYKYSGHGKVLIDNQQYTITHPLTRAGFDEGLIIPSNL